MIDKEKWWEECGGCFDSQYLKGYGPCEGCVGINDFQLKCFKILSKLFTIEDNKPVQNVQEVKLEDDETKFLKELLVYNKVLRTRFQDSGKNQKTKNVKNENE